MLGLLHYDSCSRMSLNSLYHQNSGLEDTEDKNTDIVTEQHTIIKDNQSILSGCAYCISSCSMILLNKFVLSTYNLEAGISLMFYQNLVSVVVVMALRFFGIVTTEPLTWKLLRVWFPVNIIFVGMLLTSIYSLKHINVAMISILKNAANLITAVGEMYLFRKSHSGKVWAALFLMIGSAFCGGVTDLSFHATGYAWQVLNCFLTASYSLTIRKIMDVAKHATISGNLNGISMAFLNNVLSLPLGLILIFLFGEWQYLYASHLIRLPAFWMVVTFSGVLGLAISFTSMWFLHQTGPTIYSLVGSLNKIPISIVGILLFNVPMSTGSLLSIFFGLFAGVVFARAKSS